MLQYIVQNLWVICPKVFLLAFFEANYNNCQMFVKCGVSLPADLAKFAFIPPPPPPSLGYRSDLIRHRIQIKSKPHTFTQHFPSPFLIFLYEQSSTLSMTRSSVALQTLPGAKNSCMFAALFETQRENIPERTSSYTIQK